MPYFYRLALPLLIALMGAACAPITSNHGYVFEQSKIDAVKIGTTRRAQIDKSFGSPSLIAADRHTGDAYYYIHSRFVTFSYRRRIETDRKVLAIYFDKKNRVRDMGYYGLAEKRVIAYIPRVTKTQGSELGFLEQIFANFSEFEPE